MSPLRAGLPSRPSSCLPQSRSLPRRGEFELAVRGYRLVPGRMAKAVALVLPPVELVGGLMLAFGVAVVAVGAVLGSCLVVFVLAVSANLARGRSIDCGCLGSTAARRITWWTVVRNLVLLAATVVVVVDGSRALSLSSLDWGAAGKGPSSGDAFADLAVGTLLVLSVLVVEESWHIRGLMVRSER